LGENLVRVVLRVRIFYNYCKFLIIFRLT
jgi:hypothetical protein